jgi:methylthioribulose-1-phosphate dehydratase
MNPQKSKINSDLKNLVHYSKLYYNRGWLNATAGNLSILNRNIGELWITASGRDKSSLTTNDFVLFESNEPNKNEYPDYRKPSAEISIHLSIYSLIPEANCVLHVHTPHSCVIDIGLTSKNSNKMILLPNSELIKAFGDFRESPNLSFLIVHNFGEVQMIADEFYRTFERSKPEVPFFIIENHGITVWGKDVDEANKHLEAAEFILQILYMRLK